MELRPRHVTLVLCRADGEVLGQLDPFEVASPWRQEAAPVVDACEEAHGLRPTILRLLDAEDEVPGGAVTYLAETDGRPESVLPWVGELDEHPLRMPWARPGGPGADLAWATEALSSGSRRIVGEPVQIRTWNLSSLWQLPTDAGPAWLKAVPSFFAHEAAAMRVLADQPIPAVLAGEPGRAVLAHVDGEDGYDARLDGWRCHIDTLVSIQRAAAERVAELLDAGVPEIGLATVVAEISDVVDRWAHALDAEVRDRIGTALDDAGRAVDVVEELAPLRTLVHGDAHTGNGRFAPRAVTILDWGDSFVGHPLLDLAVGDSYHPEIADEVVELWLERWRRVGFPRVAEAWEALRPLAHLRTAAVFQHFLDHIEPSERRYHEHDVVPTLLRAARA